MAAVKSSPAWSNIKTVVVLVMENRSFDHMLGWMKSINPEIDGVTGGETNPLSTSDPHSPLIHFGDQSEYVDPDPGHSIQAIYEEVYGVPFVSGVTPITPPDVPVPPMNGFAQEAEREQKGMSATVMNGFRPAAVPVYEALVREFAVCDRWFSALPSSTQPNRLFVHSATSHGLTSNDSKKLAEGLPQNTIFDSLDDAGHSFGIYYQQTPSTFFYRNLRKLKYVNKFHLFDTEFKSACKNGKLPSYVVIEPRYFDLHIEPANDDHPSHDVSEGQKFVKEVYEALRSSPQWNQILFVVTYDEHGGFFDHVPTPVGVPSPDDIVGDAPFFFKFDRLGVRVPALFISPWITRGQVVHGPSGPTPTSQFEHSSIPATVKKIFNLKSFLTKRDAWAGTFETVLSLESPRTDCPVTLPSPIKLRQTPAKEDAKLSDFQGELVQLAAGLNGDHTKVGHPENLIQGMKVSQAAEYVQNALQTFFHEGVKIQKAGADGSHVITVAAPTADSAGPSSSRDIDPSAAERQSNFFQKILPCLGCIPS